MQAAVRQRAGYDLSRFDRRSVVREQVKQERECVKEKKAVKTQVRVKRSGFTAFSFIVCFALILATLYSYAQLNELADKTAKLEKSLNTIKEETQLLEIEMSQKFGSEQIRQYAEQVLGMRKLDKSQITYVTLLNENKAEILESKPALLERSKLAAGIARGFSLIVEYIN